MMKIKYYDFIKVKESNIKAFAYDPKLKRLYVKFANRSLYEYYDVPKSIYLNWIKAREKALYHYEHIKDIYDYVRLK